MSRCELLSSSTLHLPSIRVEVTIIWGHISPTQGTERVLDFRARWGLRGPIPLAVPAPGALNQRPAEGLAFRT